jgi:hypothetical protein
LNKTLREYEKEKTYLCYGWINACHSGQTIISKIATFTTPEGFKFEISGEIVRRLFKEDEIEKCKTNIFHNFL